MQSVYEILEWNRVEELFAQRTRTEIGRNYALHLAPVDRKEYEDESLRMAEAMECYFRLGRLPIDSSSDLSHLLDLSSKGGRLTISELEAVCHDVCVAKDCKAYFSKASSFAPKIAERLLSLADCSFLDIDIHKVIAPDLSISDSASPELKRIRAAIRRFEKQIASQLECILEENKAYLSDSTLTLRNGHYVLPVANAYKNKVGGIVQDVSGTGNTTFIEPDKLVRLNNQLALLKNEEKQEIARILLELSHEVGGCSESLKMNNRLIGYLDFLQSKALFAEDFHCHRAAISEDGSLFIPGARHPLLNQETVVPNDFVIASNRKIIVISGPNAGGKTIALKTLGILSLMFTCVLPLPCKEGAYLPLFRNVYADIGDSQSIEDSLSTFSGHISRLSSICSSVGGNDLVLLDEVGTGTSPREGEALAKAVVSFLLTKHCFALISSHFEGLKSFAFESDQLENASMLFDDEQLLPTYKIKFGLPGESYGLKVAKRFGLPEEIVSLAEKDLASSSDLSVSKGIARLSKLSKENEDLREKLFKQQTTLEARAKQLDSREEALRGKEENLLKESRVEKQALIQKAKQEVQEIMDQLASPEVKLHQAIAAKKRLEELEATKEQEATYENHSSVGDYIRIPDYDLVGKIQRMRGDRITVVTPDGLTLETSLSKVLPAKEPERKAVRRDGTSLDRIGSGPSVPLELNIIGMHADEAGIAIAKYLDSCRMKGYTKVRIIHGYGSGVLRQVTQDYLKKHANFVKKYENGGEFEGGSGATVVYLK